MQFKPHPPHTGANLAVADTFIHREQVAALLHVGHDLVKISLEKLTPGKAQMSGGKLRQVALIDFGLLPRMPDLVQVTMQLLAARTFPTEIEVQVEVGEVSIFEAAIEVRRPLDMAVGDGGCRPASAAKHELGLRKNPRNEDRLHGSLLAAVPGQLVGDGECSQPLQRSLEALVVFLRGCQTHDEQDV